MTIVLATLRSSWQLFKSQGLPCGTLVEVAGEDLLEILPALNHVSR
jgi:hypothetical protein